MAKTDEKCHSHQDYISEGGVIMYQKIASPLGKISVRSKTSRGAVYVLKKAFEGVKR